jgi:hypothetical protein
VTSIADNGHNHLLVGFVICKDSLEAITQVEEVILSRNFAFKHLWLDNIVAYIDRKFALRVLITGVAMTQ